MVSPRLTKGRCSEVGAYYAITTIAFGRERLFSDSGVAQTVIEEIRRAGHGGAFETHAWVLMPDHLHWLVELRHAHLSAGVQAFKSRSALP